MYGVKYDTENEQSRAESSDTVQTKTSQEKLWSEMVMALFYAIKVAESIGDVRILTRSFKIHCVSIKTVPLCICSQV